MQNKTTRKIIKFLLAGTVSLGVIFAPVKDVTTGIFSTPAVYADYCNSKGELINDNGVVIGTCNPTD